MAKLFRFYRDGTKAGKPAEILEGIIVNCTLVSEKYAEGFSKNRYQIQLDTFELPLVIGGGGFRLERGERIRAHSFRGFDKTYRGGDKKEAVEINGLEILDLEGKTKFDYLAKEDELKWRFVQE